MTGHSHTDKTMETRESPDPWSSNLCRPLARLDVWLLALIALLLGGCTRAQAKPVPCIERAVFGDPADSDYILPYPAGAKYVLNQSYCFPDGGHRDQLAYDFRIPIGRSVVAARDGVVREVREEVPDDGRGQDPGAHNHVLIEHEDGTIAFYGHLKRDGVLVTVGEEVPAGQEIALSGNSGNTLGVPHLHFGVYQEWPAVEGFDLAVNFNNTAGPLDSRGGLIAGRFYEALPAEAAFLLGDEAYK